MICPPAAGLPLKMVSASVRQFQTRICLGVVPRAEHATRWLLLGRWVSAPVLRLRESAVALAPLSGTDSTPWRKENYPKGITSFSPALHDASGLRWVANHKLKSTLKELSPCARNGDATLLGLENILGRFTQGSSSPFPLGPTLG